MNSHGLFEICLVSSFFLFFMHVPILLYIRNEWQERLSRICPSNWSKWFRGQSSKGANSSTLNRSMQDPAHKILRSTSHGYEHSYSIAPARPHVGWYCYTIVFYWGPCFLNSNKDYLFFTDLTEWSICLIPLGAQWVLHVWRILGGGFNPGMPVIPTWPQKMP